MDSKKLEALVTAVECGSFTAAAEQLGYTQSGLTHMMNAMEKEIGFQVLNRGRSGVHLTGNGERVFPLIKECVRTNENLNREIFEIKNHQEETIRVASYASIAIHWLPEVIQQFRQENPTIDVNLQMGNVHDVYRWVREGKADMCFTSWQDSTDVEWLPLKTDELLAILPPDIDLNGESSFPIKNFDGKEFLMPSPGFYQDIMHALNSQQVKPMIRDPQVSDSVIISMVEHGLGASILSELVLRGRRDDVLAISMDPPQVRELGIAVRSMKELRPAARKFIARAKDMIESM